MAKAKQLPSGNWRVQASATIEGKTIRKSFTSVDKKKAELSALEWQNKMFKYYEDSSSLTLKEAIDKYIDSRRNILSPVTVATYEKIQRNYFLSLQEKPLSRLTHNLLQSEVNNLSETLSPKSVKNIWGLISAAIKHSTNETVILHCLKNKK